MLQRALSGKTIVAAVALSFSFALTAVTQTAARAAADSGEPLKVYVTPTPQGDVLRYVQKLADQDGSGLELKVIESNSIRGLLRTPKPKVRS